VGVQTYHTAADRLQLIPASAKRAAGIQYEISLDRSGTTASELVNVDLKVSLPVLH
jgi:kinetochore protein NDC80